jgi:hypothetical protein
MAVPDRISSHVDLSSSHHLGYIGDEILSAFIIIFSCRAQLQSMIVCHSIQYIIQVCVWWHRPSASFRCLFMEYYRRTKGEDSFKISNFFS